MCGAVEGRLSDDIVNGVDVDKLPPCPYFSLITPIIETLTISRSPLEIREHRRNRPRRPYRSPEIRSTRKVDTGTHAEVIAIIEDFYKRRNKWPTQHQIHIKSRLQSIGDIWNVLNDMVDKGSLKRLPSGRKNGNVYAVVFRKNDVVQLPAAINA